VEEITQHTLMAEISQNNFALRANALNEHARNQSKSCGNTHSRKTSWYPTSLQILKPYDRLIGTINQ